jgi:hypothetical protein
MKKPRNHLERQQWLGLTKFLSKVGVLKREGIIGSLEGPCKFSMSVISFFACLPASLRNSKRGNILGHTSLKKPNHLLAQLPK